MGPKLVDQIAIRVSFGRCFYKNFSGPKTPTTLFEDLQKRKLGLVSVRDGLDLETPAGRLMANVLASVAAYENEVRSERIVAGQDVARAEGKTWGGSAKGRRVKVTGEQISTIQRMRSESEKVAAIARATGLSRPTVYSVLSESNGNGKVA